MLHFENANSKSGNTSEMQLIRSSIDIGLMCDHEVFSMNSILYVFVIPVVSKQFAKPQRALIIQT